MEEPATPDRATRIERETKAMWGNIYQASDTTRTLLESASAHMDKDYESVDDARDQATRAAEHPQETPPNKRTILRRDLYT